MNIQPNSNNISMTGAKNSSWKSFKDRIKQNVLDTLPSATFKDDKAVDTWKKIDDYSYVGDGETPNNHIKFKDEQIKDKYKDYYFQICTVPNHQLSENDFNKLKT
jgi:hypothetical protein